MPRPTGWIATSAALALAATVLSSGIGVAAARPHVTDRAPATASVRGEWQVRTVGPGQYAVAWTSPTRLPVTSDRPTVVGPAAWAIGTSTIAADGRTVRARIDAPSRPDPARLDVRLSGARLDAVGGDRARRAAGPFEAALDLPGTRTLATDPATPGAYAVATSDYTLAPVAVPGMRAPIEMVGHVVEPAAGAPTGPRPLVLFMHGRHGTCYDPGDADAWSDRWPCKAPFREVPSHLGYDYVQQVLASQGYATVSVRVNGINAQDFDAPDGGAGARARLVQAHLDHWVGLAAAHQVDQSRVVLVGHSRGGEGVDRASIRIPLTAPYRIVGQVLIAPTDFAVQTAPYVPTVTLLPFCDGDVSDLQGQKFTDAARDVAPGDTSLKSSVLVMGANHNYFNTEWTPKTSVSPASDDWPGEAGQTCGSADPERLTAAEQRSVGTAYVAGAVHLFAAGDQSVLPLFDGSRARVASQGGAQTLSHAIGGGRVERVPSTTTALSLADGAETRFCTGTYDDRRVSSCGLGAALAAAAPLWSTNGERLPTRSFFEMAWTASGQSGGLLLASPLDLTGRRLELRTIVDGRSATAVRVRITDADGASAVVDPVGGVGLPALGTTADVRKLWAQTLVVDPTGVAVDLTRVARVDLVAASPRGRVWVADLASAPATLAAVPDRRLPTISFSRVRIAEGAGGAKTARVPFQVTGALTSPARFTVLTVGQARGDVQRFTVDLAPGQTSGSVPVGYVADQRADYRRLVTQVTAWPTRNVMTDGYLGELAVIDDDPRPKVAIRVVAREVPAGSPAQWRIRLDKRVDFDLSVSGKVVRGPGTPVRVSDIAQSWTDLHVGPVRPGKPLWRSHAMTYDVIDPGGREVVISIPTRPSDEAGATRTLTLRIDLGKRTVRRTVRIVS
jgi:dienelactone hydrolase